MSTGLLDFLNIDKPQSNWTDEITNYLKIRFIKYNIESGHIKFKINILNFDIWFECGYYLSNLKRTQIKNITINFLKNGSVTIKHKSVNDILNLIKNMVEIMKFIQKKEI